LEREILGEAFAVATQLFIQAFRGHAINARKIKSSTTFWSRIVRILMSGALSFILPTGAFYRSLLLARREDINCWAAGRWMRSQFVTAYS